MFVDKRKILILGSNELGLVGAVGTKRQRYILEMKLVYNVQDSSQHQYLLLSCQNLIKILSTDNELSEYRINSIFSLLFIRFFHSDTRTQEFNTLSHKEQLLRTTEAILLGCPWGKND